jgi:DNA-directed RNA polymerase subunit beta'
VLQYFISTHGARKGLADTALKTADSGYLTRRLCDVAQDVIITETIAVQQTVFMLSRSSNRAKSSSLCATALSAAWRSKISAITRATVIVSVNQEITEDLASQIQAAGIERVKIRSVLTCESKRGVCRLCYGRNLATGRMVERGEAVGIISAQSIGEPGTQLTMRTFHIGGAATRVSEQTTQDAKNDGYVRFSNVNAVKNNKGELIAMNRNGHLIIVDEKHRERERYQVVYGAKINVGDGAKVKANQILLGMGSVHLLDLNRSHGGRAL